MIRRLAEKIAVVTADRPGRPRLPQSMFVDQRRPVTLLKPSRPAKRNAPDDPTIVGIEALFTDPPEGTRAIVVHCEGKHFSAGADLASFVDSLAVREDYRAAGARTKATERR